jgi:hypothetical protein
MSRLNIRVDAEPVEHFRADWPNGTHDSPLQAFT